MACVCCYARSIICIYPTVNDNCNSTCDTSSFNSSCPTSSDELNKKQLQGTCHKTVLYSIHVVGVIFDGKTYTVYIADPNGPLMMGGNMEFLSLLIRKLPKGVQPSVNYLCFDRDEFTKQTTAATVKQAATKKRKAGKTRPNKNINPNNRSCSNQISKVTAKTYIIKNKNTKWYMEQILDNYLNSVAGNNYRNNIYIYIYIYIQKWKIIMDSLLQH